MRPITYSIEALLELFARKRIVTLPELKTVLGTGVNMTIFRKLQELSYRSSCSHRGQYYTLDSIIDFDNNGLWRWQSVLFSQYGTLRNTVLFFVNQSESGYSVRELGDFLMVDVKEPLFGLVQAGEIYREKFSGHYIYFSKETVVQKRQKLFRQQRQSMDSIPAGLQAPASRLLAHELKAAIILFFSLLDEKQRRLYAGLESLKLGHGGDKSLAELLRIDVHTVAKGRQELLSGEIETKGARRKGGGRKAVEKKHRKS